MNSFSNNQGLNNDCITRNPEDSNGVCTDYATHASSNDSIDHYSDVLVPDMAKGQNGNADSQSRNNTEHESRDITSKERTSKERDFGDSNVKTLNDATGETSYVTDINNSRGDIRMHGSVLGTDTLNRSSGSSGSSDNADLQRSDAIPSGNRTMDNSAEEVLGMGSNSSTDTAVPGSASLTIGEQWFNDMPTDNVLQTKYSHSAIVGLLNKSAAAERALSDVFNSVNELSATLGKLIGNVNSMVEFINGMPNNKELLFVMMQNAVAAYDEVESSIKTQSAYNATFEFSTTETDTHDRRLTLLEPNEHSSGYPVPHMEQREADGSWVADSRTDLATLTANQLTMHEAIKQGYGVGSIVYVKTIVGDNTPAI